MQTASAPLIAAITGQERRPIARLLVDWDGDGFATPIDNITTRVVSATLARELKGDLPDEVRLVEGYASAQLDVELAGDPTINDDAASYFSTFNTGSALYGKDRVGVPVTFELGMQGSAGAEYLPAMTGHTTGLPVASGPRTAKLTALDGFERLRARVALPTVVADDLGNVRPGLTGSWLLDWVLRRNTIYATPGPRANVRFSATMRGSAYPEVGSAVEVRSFDGQARFTPDTAGELLDTAQATFDEAYRYTPDGELSVNDGAGILIEFHRVQGMPSFPDTACGLVHLTNRQAGGTDDVVLMVGDAPSLYVAVSRQGAAVFDSGTILAGPVLSGSSPQYVAVHLRFTAGTVYVTWRVDSTTTTGTITSASQTSRPPLTQVRLAEGPTTSPVATAIQFEGFIGPVQVTAEPSTVTTFPGPWNNAFTPTAVLDPSLNRLTGVLPTDAKDSATLATEIVTAEQGMLFFDETGVAQFRNRAWWVSTAAQTVQRTLTTTDALTALDYDNDVKSVRNSITARATPITISAVGDVWTSQPGVQLIARGGKTVLWVAFDAAVVDLDQLIRYNNTTPGLSRISLNTKADGSGTNWTAGGLTYLWELVSATGAKLTIRNQNPTTLYLTRATGEGGLTLAGRTMAADTTSATLATATDDASITRYGEQTLNLPDNPWRQDYQAVLSLVEELLGQLATPKPVLTGIGIVGDPRLQLGDRVRIVDPDGLVLDGEYWITGIPATEFAAGRLAQRITARQATTVLLWGVGRWGVNTWGRG